MDDQDPINFPDTDWGEFMRQIHSSNILRFSALNGRIGDVEQQIADGARERATMRTEMAANTALTIAVKNDTAFLVAMSRGATAMKKFLSWASPVITALVAAWAAWVSWRTKQ